MGLNERSFPVVSLTLQSMQHSVQVALSRHLIEIQEAADAEVERAIAEFDFRGEIAKAVNAALQSSISSSIEQVGWRLLDRAQVTDAMQATVLAAIVKANAAGETDAAEAAGGKDA